MEQFNFLDKIDFKTIEIKEIINLFHDNDIIVPIVIKKIPRGTLIERGRKNIKQEEFSKKSELSYRTDIENIKEYGRANSPGESRFYGTASNKSHPRLAIFSEISEEFREGVPPPDNGVVITLGKWEVKEDFEVATLIGFSPNHKALTPKIIKVLIKLAPQGRIKDTIASFNYFSLQFAKTEINDHNDYKICNAFAHSVFNIEKLGGIVYPSVRVNYEYDNIVLSQDIVDEHLELKQAAVCSFKFDLNGEPILDFDKISNSNNIGENDFVLKPVT